MERSISESEYYNPQVRVVGDPEVGFTYANATPHHSATSSGSVNGLSSTLGGSRENLVKMDSGFSTNDSGSVIGGGESLDRGGEAQLEDSVGPQVENLGGYGGAVSGPPLGSSMCINSLYEQKIRPGEFVMRVLFAEFTSQAEKKIDAVMVEPPERSLSKSLQRGEDPPFDQLLSAFGSVAEHCLPSILQTLFSWYDRQAVTWLGSPITSSSISSATGSTISAGMESLDKEQIAILKELDPIVSERRDLAVEFIFCLVFIEVLQQLPFHPGHMDLVSKIEDLAFAHFKYREGSGVNAANGLVIADLYAEVLGVMAQARFASVRLRFLHELSELRGREATASNTQSIISLLMGMKFFRIKMAPIEDFEASFQFLTECAKYFLEVKQRDIKHALAGLFVEILVDLAQTVKNEVNVPCLKSFVEMLYAPTLDMCTRSKHRLALFPLVTCLLCVSQRPFFLHNWHYFLAMCLSQLKSREPKMSRVALESLYRLLWAYMIRIKCESNSATQSRLLSVVNSLFPKGSKGVVPRDTPLNIFVKIIQFIAQERLDFAMREIVFELLSVGRPIKIILTPERMNIGLRAFLVVADSLQQKDGDPPMPRSMGVMPSGNTLLRVKKTFLNKVLTEDTARSIGMASYFPLIKKVFTDILRALDLQCGRQLMLTSVKEQEESLLSGDRKAKIDLFRTCVAAIPRLIPDGMSRNELLSLLSRLTLHIDEELRVQAFQSLQSLLIDLPEWRNDVLTEFITFVSKDVPDTSPQQLDNALRMLLQLLTSWRNCIASSNANNKAEVPLAPSSSKGHHHTRYRDPQNVPPAVAAPPNLSTFYQAEGLGLLMLCSVRASTRRIGAHILKEIKGLSELLGLSETPVLDVIDGICPGAVEGVLHLLPPGEKQAVGQANQLDLQWLCDRTSQIWYITDEEECPPSGTNSATTSLSSSLGLLQSSAASLSSSSILCTADVSIQNDPWALCLVHFLDYQHIPSQCPRTVLEAWSILMPKLTSLYNYIEPSPVADNRASILRSAGNPRKPPTDRSLNLKLWRNYLIFAFKTVPPNVGSSLRCISPDMGVSSSPEATEGRDGKSPLPLTCANLVNVSPSSLYKMVIPLIRSEVSDIRDLAVFCLGLVNHLAVRDLFEELGPLLKEACDRKQENVRRRKRKDILRLQIVKIIELISSERTFGLLGSYWMGHTTGSSSSQHHLSSEGGFSLPTPLLEFLESCRGWLENETDRENGMDIRISFCNSIWSLIRSFEIDLKENLLKKEMRKQLFNLCIGWANNYSQSYWNKENGSLGGSSSTINMGGVSQRKLDFVSLKAAISLLTCGPCFQLSLLSEDSTLYSWIDFLLLSEDVQVSEVAEEMVIMLLEFNPDMGAVLDWAVSRCFTGTPQVSDACFRSIATIFSAREYPCDRYVAIINVALLYCGSAKFELQKVAFQLLQILDKRFFGGIPALGGQEGSKEQLQPTLDVVLGRVYFAKSQTYISKQLSLIHPDLTMPIFSEISWRMKSARSDVRQSLLRYLQPWLHNMELVEPAIPCPNLITSFTTLDGPEGLTQGFRHSISSASSCSLCGKKYSQETEQRLIRRGWGSREATEMVLNNLLYLTAKFGSVHEREIEECWQTLCCSSPNNQRVVLYYLLIVTGLAPNEILPHAKRVLIYLFRARPVKLLEDLMAELQTVESLNWLVERTETPPFYRLSHLRKTCSYSENNVSNTSAIYNGGYSSNNVATARESVNRLNTSELEKGTIHTKRRSAEETVFHGQPHLRSSSSGAPHLFRSEKTRTISGPAALAMPDASFLAGEREKTRTALYETQLLNGNGEIREFSESDRYPSSETIAAGKTSGGGGIYELNEPEEHPVVITERLEFNHQNAHGRGLSSSYAQVSHKLLPLPMPEYGGYYAPLKEFFPAQQVSPFHRCNLGLMFICELVNEGNVITLGPGVDGDGKNNTKEKRIDWASHYLPLMIHMCFLGMDNSRPLVPAHCFSLITNLLTVAGGHNNYLAISRILLNQQAKELSLGISLPNDHILPLNFLNVNLKNLIRISKVLGRGEEGEEPGHNTHQSPTTSQSPKITTRSHSPPFTNTPLVVIPEPTEEFDGEEGWGADVRAIVHENGDRMGIEELTLSFIKFLTQQSLNTSPLWPYEDITARVWNIKSAASISALVENTIGIFNHSFPGSQLDSRWASVSLQVGLSCSSRHYAGRSLEIYRALRVPLVSRVLVDILSRLVETVAEPGDDMQGYVTELILTLAASVEAIEVEGEGNYNGSEVEESSSKEKRKEFTCSTNTITPEVGNGNESPPPPPQMRARSGTETFGQEKRPDLHRSRSVQSLGGLQDGPYGVDGIDLNLHENGVDVIPQVFWLALSLLESDYEHEYLLALRLLESVMDRLPFGKIETRDKVERVQSQLQWNSFPGIIHLLLKGFTNTNTYEQSLNLLCRFIPFLDYHFVDPSGEAGFPLTVMALLPYLLSHYDDPTPLCLQAAQLIADVGGQRGEDGCQALQNLATVMTLYSRRSFSKDCVQWSKCVVKYLYDSHVHLAPLLLGFLLEVLEKGPFSIHSSVLATLNCFFNYVDLANISSVSPELLRAIEKHLSLLYGAHWRESLRILKLVVTRSSSLYVPPPLPSSYGGISGPSSMSWDTVSTVSSAFSSELEFSGHLKKELPGRTMEFSFDVSQTPIIGRRHTSSAAGEGCPSTGGKEEIGARLSIGLLGAQRSGSIGEIGFFNQGIGQAAWKRPWQSQGRVRECLVALLNASGQRVGLPKSPSVIFSQSSELMERQSSVASSTEEVSVAINDTSGGSRVEDASSDAHFRVFRDFDFLEYELEDIEGESNDNFNWGVRRRPLSELGEPETEGEADESTIAHSLSHSQGPSLSNSNDFQANPSSPTHCRSSEAQMDGFADGGYGIELIEPEGELEELARDNNESRNADTEDTGGKYENDSSDEEEEELRVDDVPLQSQLQHSQSHGDFDGGSVLTSRGRERRSVSDPSTPQPSSLIELGSSHLSSPTRSRPSSSKSEDGDEEPPPEGISNTFQKSSDYL